MKNQAVLLLFKLICLEQASSTV